jgi:hypothetical protein
MIPSCVLRPSPGFIRWPESGGFILLKACQYQSMGAT